MGNHWTESIGMNLKPSFDMALTEGLDRLVWHQFASSPAEMGLPGQEYFAGTYLNTKVTWWEEAGAFTAYLNRGQFMMQQGCLWQTCSITTATRFRTSSASKATIRRVSYPVMTTM